MDSTIGSIRLIRPGDRIALAGDIDARVGSDYASRSGTLGPHGVGNLKRK